MKQRKNLHRKQIADFIASDCFTLGIVAIGVIAVLVHQWGMYAG